MSHRSPKFSDVNTPGSGEPRREVTYWLSPKQVCEMFSLSEATLCRWIKSREGFPQGVKFSPSCTRFSSLELSAFVNSLVLR